jgi:thiaminase/transcriptional activator TenA
MGDGSLPETAFRHYLIQDYLFLIHFARAYALAVYKSDTLADMRAAATTVNALLNVEMALHVEFCSGWGIAEADMQAVPEARATIAYTRYVLERGMAGDVLDLQVALSPCVIGYAEIATRLKNDPASRLEGNPYLPWVDMYAGEEYGVLAAAAKVQLDRLGEGRLTAARFDTLKETFRQATRLEGEFWEMGWTLAD